MTLPLPLHDFIERKKALPVVRYVRAHRRHPSVTRDELALILAHDLQHRGMAVFSRRLYRVLQDVYGQGADAMLAEIAAFIPQDDVNPGETAPDKKAKSGRGRRA